MGEKGRLIKNSFLYTFSALLIKAMAFFLLPIYTTFLGTDEYGIVNLFNSFIQVALFIVAFSLFSAIIRTYVDDKNNKERLKRFYGTIIVFVFLSSICFLAIGVIFNSVLTNLVFKNIPFFPIVFFTLVTLMFYTLHTVHQSILQAMQQGQKLAIINIFVFVLQAGLTIVLIGPMQLGAFGVLLAILFVNFVYVIYMLLDLLKNDLIVFCLDKKILKEALKYSIPLMPHDLSLHIAAFASRIFININYSLSYVGLYSIATQFGYIVDIVQTSINQAYSPWFFSILKEGTEERKKDIENVTKYIIILYSILYLIIGLFCQEVIILMTSVDYRISWMIVPIFIIAYSVKSIYYFYANLLYYHKDSSKFLFIATLSGSLIDIILSFFLIPVLGMYGSAISFLITKIILSVIIVIISKRHNDIGFSVINMIKIILPSSVLMGFGLFFSYTRFSLEFNTINFLYKIGILLVYFIYLFFTNKKMFVEILRSGKVRHFFKERKALFSKAK